MKKVVKTENVRKCTAAKRLCLEDNEPIKKACGTFSEFGYMCTRKAKHKGPHVACGTTHHNCQVWEDYNE